MKKKWRCKKCGEVLISDSKEHHKLDMCKCGKSGCDLEELYCRLLGDAEIIEKKR